MGSLWQRALDSKSDASKKLRADYESISGDGVTKRRADFRRAWLLGEYKTFTETLVLEGEIKIATDPRCYVFVLQVFLARPATHTTPL